MLASIHELTRKYTKDGSLLSRDRKKISISTLFQKVCLGWKLPVETEKMNVTIEFFIFALA